MRVSKTVATSVIQYESKCKANYLHANEIFARSDYATRVQKGSFHFKISGSSNNVKLRTALKMPLENDESR